MMMMGIGDDGNKSEMARALCEWKSMTRREFVVAASIYSYTIDKGM